MRGRQASRGRRILFLSGTDRLGKGSRRYRCHHRVEQLASVGVDARVEDFRECDLHEALREHDCFVVHRIPWRKSLERFIVGAHRLRKPVLFDTDDFVFDAAAADLMAPNPQVPLEEAREKLARHGRTLALCGAGTVSTEPLAALARRRGLRAEVAPNVATRAMVEAGLREERAPRPSRPLTLGYFSGTPTHDRDFAEVAEPLFEVLRSHPDARLLVVGPLELEGWARDRRRRIDRLELQPWQELPSLFAPVDVNLAPLESGNAFAACKSCLKFLEAALVGVPTVASRVPDFSRVIRHGENGMLAATPREWREALERLMVDAELRQRLGSAAGDDVRRYETTDARKHEFAETLDRLFGAARPTWLDATMRRGRSVARRAARSLAGNARR